MTGLGKLLAPLGQLLAPIEAEYRRRVQIVALELAPKWAGTHYLDEGDENIQPAALFEKECGRAIVRTLADAWAVLAVSPTASELSGESDLRESRAALFDAKECVARDVARLMPLPWFLEYYGDKPRTRPAKRAGRATAMTG